MNKIVGTNNDNVPKFGVTSDNNALNLANFNSKSGSEIFLFPLSTSYLNSQQSKSKVFKRQAVHLIRFCLKSGINENKDIIQFLKANKCLVLMSVRQIRSQIFE